MPGDVQIPIASADVAADIAKYTNKVSRITHINHTGSVKKVACIYSG